MRKFHEQTNIFFTCKPEEKTVNWHGGAIPCLTRANLSGLERLPALLIDLSGYRLDYEQR